MEAHDLAVERAVELDGHRDQPEADRSGPNRAGHASVVPPLGAANHRCKSACRPRGSEAAAAHRGRLHPRAARRCATLSRSGGRCRSDRRDPGPPGRDPAAAASLRHEQSAGRRARLHRVDREAAGGPRLRGPADRRRLGPPEPDRPPAPGAARPPPLLLQGHVDVVAARGDWRHPPFAGELHDGYVWGRGALDMKGGVAMMLAAFMRAEAAPRPRPGT